MLEAADLILIQTETYLRNKELSSIDNSKSVWEYLVNLSNKIPQLRSIWIADAKGKMLVYSGKYPTPTLNVLNRDYFINARSLKGDNYYLGPPIKGKYTGKPFFSMSRALRNSHETFRGVVVAAMEPEYINIFKDISMKDMLFRIYLISEDGTVYSEYPKPIKGSEKETGLKIKTLLSDKNDTILHGSFKEGKMSALSKRRLGNTPFLVISEYGTSNIVFSLWSSWSFIVVPIAVVYMLMTILFVFLIKKMRLEEEARLEAEKAMSESEERLRRLGNNMPNGLLYQISVSPSGERSFNYITSGVEKMFHVTADQVLKNPKILYDLIHPDDVDNFLKTEEAAIKALKEFETFARFKVNSANSKEEKWIQIRSIPHVKEDKTVTWDGFVIDMTKEHQLESELRHSQRMESIGQLAGGVAHDFNNMLAGIIGSTELLEHMNLPEKASKYLQIILKSATRASSLTKQLLAFSRKADYPVAPLNLHQVIRDAVALLERSIDRKIELRLELNAEKTFVRGDAGLLENGIINLGINARDAINDDCGIITFQTSNITLTEEEIKNAGHEICPGDYIKFTVTDNGAGIDSLTLPMIFDPFFSTKEVGKGTGLGLSVTYGVIKKYNGNISVESQKGEGTTFTILLPLVLDQTISDEPAEKEENFDNKDALILVIEDEPTVRETIEMQINHFGYNVITAINGTDGVARFQENQDQIRLVVLDLIMPEMSGDKVFEEIRKVSPQLPIILYSGYSSNTRLNEMLKKENVSFIQKPFGQNDLKKMITKALEVI